MTVPIYRDTKSGLQADSFFIAGEVEDEMITPYRLTGNFLFCRKDGKAFFL